MWWIHFVYVDGFCTGLPEIKKSILVGASYSRDHADWVANQWNQYYFKPAAGGIGWAATVSSSAKYPVSCQ